MNGFYVKQTLRNQRGNGDDLYCVYHFVMNITTCSNAKKYYFAIIFMKLQPNDSFPIVS